MGGGREMAHESSCHAASLPNANMKAPERRTVASYERELEQHRCTENRLREALAREEALLRQKDELIQQQAGLEQGVRS